ncbi:MAG: helix-turn-helix domain-containing protein [Boseongicola sp. SB0677_bin_26]|nr:helix-turn-helix domain-containing protein [Boseongicola sp. SB0665_bin_10]MYG27673.1 helix-turn-helix domain-containing protein [Boseongicola sp. SB0677_bin_26]
MEKSIYSPEYSAFLQFLRESRRLKGFTQTEVGVRLGASQSFVSKCERGQRRLDLVETREFCKALEIDFIDFVCHVHERLSAATSEHPNR